jgi:diguanylate cyclase (GGDEF)-like protein
MVLAHLLRARTASRWRWRRCRRDLRHQRPPRGLVPALLGTTLISSGVILTSALNGERFKDDLLRQFVEEKINQIARNLEAETLDWAVWNETHDHLLNRNPSYYKDQYNQYSFARTPFVVSLNRQGGVHSSTTWDFNQGQPAPLSSAQERAVQLQIPSRTPLQASTFLGRFEGRPFLFSAQPVRSTDSSAVPSGRLLFVRPLDTEDVSFKDSETLNRALGVTREFYGKTPERQLNPLAPVHVTVPLKRWQANTPMQLVIERQPRERLQALHTIAGLILAAGGLLALVTLRSYAQGRRFRLLELRNQRTRLQTSRDLEKRRNHDELTGLLSESGLLQAMACQANRFPGFLQAVVHIDLDHFSVINNGLGKGKGDQVLVTFASRLQETIHPSGAIARIGGDTFGCSLVGTSDSALRTEVSSLSQHLNNLKIDLDSQLLNITVSIGASMIQEENLARAMHEASVACSVVKVDGGHGYQFYGDTKGSTSSYLAIQQANQELIAAIHDKRLELHAQHAWQLNQSQDLPATYVELLCRIRHPDTGKPYWRENIIEAAHLCGSLPLFDQTIIELACSNLSELIKRSDGPSNHPELIYAINITPDTLIAPSFVQTLDHLMDSHGLDPRIICLEITEQAALRNPGEAMRAMRKLRQLGFRMALDDFGTGMTSLGYLRDLPLDYVKIDKSFIRKSTKDRASNLVVQFVVELSQEIGFQTIAEGVEDMEQLLELQAAGISIAQGCVITRPRAFLCNSKDWIFAQSRAETLAKQQQPASIA